MRQLIEEVRQHLGGMSIEDIKKWRDELPGALPEVVKNGVRVMKVLEGLRYGTITEDEAQRKIDKIYHDLRREMP